MIVSKPKSQALFAIGVFVLICLSLGSYNLYLILKGSPSLFNYVMAILFLPVAVIFMLRMLFNYKIISLGDDKVQIWYPLRFKTIRGKLKDMDYWQETIIQTKTGVFKQIEIVFPGRIIKMSIQENSNYQDAANYLKRKQGKKRRK